MSNAPSEPMPIDDESAQSALLDDYMDDDELAADLHVSPRTIQRWDRLGEGPPITRIGRKKLRRRPAARQWLLSRERAFEGA